MAHLHEFRPDLVDYIVTETSAEAKARRDETHRVNTLLFIERMLGQIFAFCVGIGGVVGGGYIALHNQPWAGASIAAATITGLAVAFLGKFGGR
jgi:hypothetical protein